MFASLDMTKKMSFNDGSSLDFQTAQKKLAQEIGLSPFSESNDIEAKIFTILKKSASQLAVGIAVN